MKEKFTVTGMSCAACSTRVENSVRKLNGTEKVSVNLLTGTMQVDYDEGRLQRKDIIKAVEKAGYGAFVETGEKIGVSGVKKPSASAAALDETKQMKKRLIWSVVLLIPLMAVSMSHMFTGGGVPAKPLTNVLTQVLFLIPIVFLNRKFFVKGFPNLFKGRPNMDSLIAMGSSAAIIYGVFVIFSMTAGYENGDTELVYKYAGDVYFESGAMILTLITIGKYLETRSKGKTSQAIEKLMDLAPKTATVERDGVETEIPAEALRAGDILVIRPGESVAADGIVLSGRTSIDESAITGESIPVEKREGDPVVSATINKTGFIRVRADKVGDDTTISQIIRLVDEASASKAPIARLADKIAGIFVPAVIGIAVAAAAIWIFAGASFEFALSIGIAVLVISCPCALGLATPVAIMVGTGKGAENGILIKSGEALETAHSIDTVVMDKTGTITEGRPKVTDVFCFGISEEDLVRISAGLEKGSEHPLAEAICSYAGKKQIEPGETENFQAIFGKGIKGEIGGQQYFAGNAALMEENGIDLSEAEEKLNKTAGEGKTPLIFSDREKVLGIIAVADMEKESSKEAIEEFRKMNIDVVMLTGDNRKTAEAIKKRLHIPRVIAEVLPADKEKRIAELQGEGHRVAMIGDGINDAPALAKADVGIAIGAGTDVAIESADAVLMRNDLMDAVAAIRLSKAVIRNIKQNLFWAFFYNAIGIPLAAGVFFTSFGIKLSPMIGAAAMSMSSVCVVSNALRLRRFKIKRLEKGGNIKEEREKQMKYDLKIKGMMCEHCKRHMTDGLNAMDGVKAEIDLEKGIAHVTAGRAVSEAEFREAVENEGYTLTGMETL